MATMASRGDLAFELFKALGITEPTSKGRFSDGGYLDGITSTLSDMGITNGISPTEFGTGRVTTRGEAFTMIARALGLADASTSIADASAALVEAGVVKGYSNNPNDLGLNDPLQKDHLKLLVDRVTPMFNAKKDTGVSPSEEAQMKADNAKDKAQAAKDPKFAAYLANLGVAKGELEDEIKRRAQQYLMDQKLRSEGYKMDLDAAMRGVGQDFENRGLWRSGTHAEAKTRKGEMMSQKHKESEARMAAAHKQAQKELEMRKNKIDRELSMERIGSHEGSAANQISGSY